MGQRFCRAAVAAILTALASVAGACEVEDWRWYTSSEYLTIEGTTTCAAGKIVLRVYEGEGEGAKFLGIANDRFEGYAFEATAKNVSPPPQAVSIKYAIEPGG